MENFFEELPKNLYLEIFRFLTPEENAKLSRVCKEWKKFLEDDFVWKQKCNELDVEKEYFHQTMIEEKTKNYKELYKILAWPSFDPQHSTKNMIFCENNTLVYHTQTDNYGITFGRHGFSHGKRCWRIEIRGNTGTSTIWFACGIAVRSQIHFDPPFSGPTSTIYNQPHIYDCTAYSQKHTNANGSYSALKGDKFRNWNEGDLIDVFVDLDKGWLAIVDGKERKGEKEFYGFWQGTIEKGHMYYPYVNMYHYSRTNLSTLKLKITSCPKWKDPSDMEGIINSNNPIKDDLKVAKKKKLINN